MMGRAAVSIFVCTVAVGCGPRARDPVLAERCGQTEPIQLLALAPDETAEGNGPLQSASPGFVSVAPYGDRWLIGVRRYDRALGPETPLVGDDAPTLVSSRIVSVDACGGDTRVVAEGVHQLRVPTGDEPWIGCGEDRGVVAFDPDVESSGWQHEQLGCIDQVVDGAFITMETAEDGGRALVRARLRTDGPADVKVLVADADWPTRVVDDPYRFVTLDADSALVEVDARTGALELLREGVEDFYISDDARFVQWSPDADSNNGSWWLWDRQTDEERALGLEDWPEVTSYGIRTGVVSTFLSPYDAPFPDPMQQLVLLPGQETLVLDGVWGVRARIDGALVLSELQQMAVLDPGSDQLRLLPDDAPQRSWTEGNSLWGLFHHPDPYVRSHSVRELAAPDFGSRLVANDVWFPLRVSDGRWLTVRERGPGEGHHGTLVVLDEDGAAATIDHDVIETLYAYNGGEQPGGVSPLVESVVVYPVRDAEHERTGVWLAELATP